MCGSGKVNERVRDSERVCVGVGVCVCAGYFFSSFTEIYEVTVNYYMNVEKDKIRKMLKEGREAES